MSLLKRLALSVPFVFHRTRSLVRRTCATARRAAESLVFSPPVRGAKEGGRVEGGSAWGRSGNPWLPRFSCLKLRTAAVAYKKSHHGVWRLNIHSTNRTESRANERTVSWRWNIQLLELQDFPCLFFPLHSSASTSQVNSVDPRTADQWGIKHQTWIRSPSRKTTVPAGDAWTFFSSRPSFFCLWRWQLWQLLEWWLRWSCSPTSSRFI